MKRKLKTIIGCLAAAMLAFTGCTSRTAEGFLIQDGHIVIPTPERAEGQTDVLELTTPKLDVVRVGFVGLGMRGPGAVRRFTNIEGVEIKALCDYEPERVEKAQAILEKAGFPKAAEYSGEYGYKELCERDDIDLVYIATDWLHHVPVATYAMEHGKNAALEVPSAMNLEEIWTLINLAESKRLHCIPLENCCYDFFELTSLNMAQHNLFGEILHVEGSYIHNLEGFWNAYWNNWRLDYNSKHRGDVYPTHGLGPVCQVLNIHRGDRLKTLVAMDTKSVNGKELQRKKTGEADPEFRNGDHTITIISTENGKTINLQHNVMTPRPYSRMYQLTGTKGFANKYPVTGLVIDQSQIAGEVVDSIPNLENLSGHGFVPKETEKALMQQYMHPIHRQLQEKAKKVGGHGGMDFVMDSRIVHCLRNGLPMDMDVYDLAEWCCVSQLSEISLDNGNLPVLIPDFTRGGWNKINGLKFAE